jgi:hypothetical protein
MAWLDSGLPVTLVMDLLDAAGPDSARILREERPPTAQLEWLAAFTNLVDRQSGQVAPSQS